MRQANPLPPARFESTRQPKIVLRRWDAEAAGAVRGSAGARPPKVSAFPSSSSL